MKKPVLFISLLILFISPASALSAPRFEDVSDFHLNEEAINVLKAGEVIEGYADGTFKPDNTINRAEFTKILMETFFPDESQGSECFPDVHNEWFAKYICTALEKEIIQGNPNGLFEPGKNINLAEAGKIISEASGMNLEESEKYWFENFLTGLAEKKAIPATIDEASQKITRGEMAEMVWRLDKEVTDKPSKTFESLISVLPEISSCEELAEKKRLLLYKNNRNMYFEREMMMFPEGAFDDTESDTAKAFEEATAQGPGGGGAEGESGDTVESSSTNVQVEGVDEADIVKNDNEYIYVVKGDTIRIIKAYPPTEMTEVSEVAFDDKDFNPRDMYVDSDRLVVIGDSYDSDYYSLTKIYIFDISVKTAISEIRTVQFEGSYSTSRKVDDRVYLVMNKYDRYYEVMGGEELLPKYLDSSVGKEMPLVGCTDVRFFPRYDEMNYLIVASVPLEGAEQQIEREVLMGASENVFSSRENLYVARTVYDYDELQTYDYWAPPIVSTSTAVYRFALNDGDIEFANKGNVPGHIKNQFSMDEYNGYFRIVTTSGDSWNDTSSNNLYILDVNNMQLTGNIENMAPGEEIYSARFIGDRAYMVTFKRIDPFFVLDVSDPSNPKVLGALKIPGYSDYLHPYDENHIIGVGKDTVAPTEEEMEFGWGDFVWYQGIKIAMFDVTDVSNPIQMYQEIIGDRGTESDLLSDHKALLFDKEKGIFAFPVLLAEIPEEEKLNNSGDMYGEYTYQGAYIYHVDLENGFQFKGRITHYDGDEMSENDSYNWWELTNVKRILYIGKYFYTVSMEKIFSNRMTDLEKVSEAQLGGEVENDGVWIEPMPVTELESEGVPGQ